MVKQLGSQDDLSPVVPLRGMISASGDLMLLAYVVGTIQGRPGILVRSGCRTLNTEQGLKAIGTRAITLRPEEGLDNPRLWISAEQHSMSELAYLINLCYILRHTWMGGKPVSVIIICLIPCLFLDIYASKNASTRIFKDLG
ncbi:hypothetical protein FE257_012319 [Aspergillus nanangensis]|uniref:Uncharacterized protein n=1 Tax=Aspergillus nanangensis TaxID=2582783 RepID=A0AAD4CGG4_ASPNN|nr:hypothetical protein FE257_012319 [Aspergillus nanangensis]